MKISLIKISNVLGIEDLEFVPGEFTEISGENGRGKTSVLEAIKSVFKNGHDATLLRNGAEKGEVVLVLDDGAELKRKITATGSVTDVIKDGKKVNRPAEYIKKLADMISVNPVAFLRAEKKDRVKVLLESMPIEIDAEELSKRAGIPVNIQPGVHAMHAIAAIHTQVYDERTGTNRAVKEKTATIKQLRDAIPPINAGVSGDEPALLEQLQQHQAVHDTEIKRIDTKLAGLRSQKEAAQQAIRNEIDALREQIAAKTAEISLKDSEFAVIEQKAEQQRGIAKTKMLEAQGPINSELAIIRNDREAAGRRQQTLDTIANMETELEELVEEAAAKTAALGEIEAYKSELLNSLPIEGLEVIDGEIYRGGVQLDRLNTAQQVDIAVEIAKLRAGELGVICVDGIELLDERSYEAFRERALDSELQLFVTKVNNDEFGITVTD